MEWAIKVEGRLHTPLALDALIWQGSHVLCRRLDSLFGTDDILHNISTLLILLHMKERCIDSQMLARR